VKKLRDEQHTLDHNARQKADDAWRKTSFDGALGHLAVLGFAVNDATPDAAVDAGLPRRRDQGRK
jgi:hypothetical protein